MEIESGATGGMTPGAPEVRSILFSLPEMTSCADAGETHATTSAATRNWTLLFLCRCAMTFALVKAVGNVGEVYGLLVVQRNAFVRVAASSNGARARRLLALSDGLFNLQAQHANRTIP